MTSRRIIREKRTVKAMIMIYCRRFHKPKVMPCERCQELLNYALHRLTLCPFQEGKTTCGKCRIHCYKPEIRQEIQKVMRIVGPKMLLYHPMLAIYHLLDGFRKSAKKSIK
ncbi:MAG: nitrous oxide-stimulated promoter family protein [Desulfobulbaceae bacterium]|nr:nitrous oxide-stimulated promoter family protein [Desulfobulbaceae bacterium]